MYSVVFSLAISAKKTARQTSEIKVTNVMVTRMHMNLLQLTSSLSYFSILLVALSVLTSLAAGITVW